MSATVLYMSTSLDGFVAGPNESMDNGLGDGGERLVEWEMATNEYDTDVQGALRSGGVNGKVIDEFMFLDLSDTYSRVSLDVSRDTTTPAFSRS